jgi:hypothetical protein
MDSSSEPEVVVFRTFGSRIEAEVARSALEAFGIWCLVLGDDPRVSRRFQEPIRLMVQAEDRAAATDVLGPVDTNG